jgi:hypothetical protein
MPIPRDLAIYLLLFSAALGVILPIAFGWTKRKKAPDVNDAGAE